MSGLCLYKWLIVAEKFSGLLRNARLARRLTSGFKSLITVNRFSDFSHCIGSKFKKYRRDKIEEVAVIALFGLFGLFLFLLEVALCGR